MKALALLLTLPLWLCPRAMLAGGYELVDPTVPYRTDTANARLPWYRLKSGEFPPVRAAHRVSGDLVEANFIHRSGQFRAADTGELMDFKLLPFGTVHYLNAEADLRDVPLGTYCHFYLFQDDRGDFTQAASIRDEYSLRAGQGIKYRLAEVKLNEGVLGVIPQDLSQNPPDLGPGGFLVDETTRVWKGDRQLKLSDLVVGDLILVNQTAATGGLRRCTDIWVGAETHQRATEQQRKKHNAFLKARGLPAWIDRVEGKKLVVTLFGDPAGLRALFKDEGIVPSQWAAEHRQVGAAVANGELRTYNPPVDQQRSTVLEYQSVPAEGYGCGGVRWTIQPNLLLEGFRKGRILRLFKDGWPVRDMAVGEGLYTEAPDGRNEEESANQYPFRTDFANESLPWYRLQPGQFPPYGSEHRVGGELVSVDAARRAGQFRADRTGELVNFTMPPYGSALYLNAEADLEDLPTGTHYHFFLYQDEGGAFTRAALVMDDYTRLAQERLTLRLEAADARAGKIFLARQLAPVKNEREELVRPPDLGRGEWPVDGQTRVWKGDRRVSLGDLAPGDELLVNLTGRTATSPGRCTDLWVGVETHALATGRQRAKHNAFLQEHGLPGWIEQVDGNALTVTFFSGSRKDFPALLGGDPWGKPVYAILADEQLRPRGPALNKMGFKNHLPEGDTAGTHGCSGVRWVIGSAPLPEGYRQGQILRVFKEGWLMKGAPHREP